MSRVRELIDSHAAHAARTVVLLPFIHLLQPAREAWARQVPLGFMPRFETTQTWSAASWFEPGEQDITGEAARDLLSAQAMLARAGLGSHADVLAPRLVEAARGLVPVAAAIEPGSRRAWAARMRSAIAPGLDSAVLSREAAIANIAIEWTAASSFATDFLFTPAATTDVDVLVVTEGLRPDPLAAALVRRFAPRGEIVKVPLEGDGGCIEVHETSDPADEAERAAACVLRHIREGRAPVALAAIDRVLTRRIRAMLEQGGAAIRDETGWKLSTTRAGAHVMLVLRACLRTAGTDAVVDWLKNSSAHPPGCVLALERRVRREGIREWRFVRPADFGAGTQAVFESVNALRDSMQESRALPQWLRQLRATLQASGQWRELERDAAGEQVVAALHLSDAGRAELEHFAPARRRMSLAEFAAWVNDTLEAGNFRPAAADGADVVILPFHQLLARPFAALVMPGCDETRLPVSPDPAGPWSSSQRKLLGLPSREELETETREAWRQALQTARCDILWRRTDDSGEAQLPSPLLQQRVLEGGTQAGTDPRTLRDIATTGTARPVAKGKLLPVEKISATAYDDLRLCPYRFFARRQLALQEPEEIDVDIDKREFGNWLHRVLNNFHTSLAARGGDRRKLLDEAAAQVTGEMRLDEGEFLPFSAAWAQAREGYLDWLARHEAAEGAAFESAEEELRREYEGVHLLGRIDRIDMLRSGVRMVMDYKTENHEKTRNRVRDPGEDTQLAFYAALLADDSLRAAYVNVNERGETRTVEQKEVALARDLLLEGIVHDLHRIEKGESLTALGEGVACEYCAARGLCRKDFWA
ncbi:MAG TPA: PD-(D/E)XK nuclease family protein [Ramlibacter sp.]|nr:PD-(D/E)XK nuclease family protein [Ramlibacter sp.]